MMDVQLPDGIKTETGLVYDKARIGEITGQQQNYLMDIEALSSGLSHIEKIVSDLVVGFYGQDGSEFKGDVKEAIRSKISTSDVETILIRIRENTYGPIYYPRGLCTKCGKENEMKLDLSTLEVVKSPDEEKGKVLAIELPRSKKKAELCLMHLDALHKTYNYCSTPKGKKELVTGMAALMMQSLDGKQNPTSEDVKALPALDLKFINEQYEKLGGKVDTTITHECKYCKKDFDTKLNVVDPNFFSPT